MPISLENDPLIQKIKRLEGTSIVTIFAIGYSIFIGALISFLHQGTLVLLLLTLPLALIILAVWLYLSKSIIPLMGIALVFLIERLLSLSSKISVIKDKIVRDVFDAKNLFIEIDSIGAWLCGAFVGFYFIYKSMLEIKLNTAAGKIR